MYKLTCEAIQYHIIVIHELNRRKKSERQVIDRIIDRQTGGRTIVQSIFILSVHCQRRIRIDTDWGGESELKVVPTRAPFPAFLLRLLDPCVLAPLTCSYEHLTPSTGLHPSVSKHFHSPPHVEGTTVFSYSNNRRNFKITSET